MKFNSNTLVWGTFAVTSLLTMVVRATFWYTKWYWAYLSILGILSVVFAAMALKGSGFRLWAAASVVVGLLIGQGWFVEGMAAQILWSISGFAPQLKKGLP